jgi:hypothetical protein
LIFLNEDYLIRLNLIYPVFMFEQSKDMIM